MARRAVAASFVLGSLALLGQGLTQGCTQDFGTFDGSGGSEPAGTSTASTVTGTGTPTSSSSGSGNPTTTTGAGGGDGGAGPTTTTGVGGEGGDGGGGCDGGADCDDDNPCTTDVCEDGVCDNLAVGDGPLGGEDDPEDCRDVECVSGALVDEADDTEDPTDANPPCELTICAGGVPTPDPADEGTVCGPDPQICDGEGTCLGCDPEGDPTQCGATTVCSAPSCEDPGECDPGFFDEGTPVTDPTDGDCQASQCAGDSVVPETVDDDADVPADRPCGDGACDNGTPDFDVLDEGDPCNGQLGVCDGAGDLAANCKTCRDTAAAAGQDAGCSAGAPICAEGEAGGMGVCHACLDTGSGANDDLGCASAEVCDAAADGGVGECVGCYGGGTPVNCGVGEVCRDPAEECGDCADTALGTADAGCADPNFPACDESGSSGDGTCEECQDDADCATRPEGHLCNQSGGDQCGCSGGVDSASCTGSSRGTRCQSGTACGCNGAAASTDCDHAGSAGPNCNAGVCGP